MPARYLRLAFLPYVWCRLPHPCGAAKICALLSCQCMPIPFFAQRFALGALLFLGGARGYCHGQKRRTAGVPCCRGPCGPPAPYFPCKNCVSTGGTPTRCALCGASFHCQRALNGRLLLLLCHPYCFSAASLAQTMRGCKSEFISGPKLAATAPRRAVMAGL